MLFLRNWTARSMYLNCIGKIDKHLRIDEFVLIIWNRFRLDLEHWSVSFSLAVSVRINSKNLVKYLFLKGL